jgi:uncharacterized protein (DUF433 family)
MSVAGDTPDWEDRIIVDEAVLTGKPVVKGTRIAVDFIIELLAEGWSHEEILRNYPRLQREDILAALRWASEALRSERVYPLPATPA